MKKLLSLLTVITLILSVSLPTFADLIDRGGGLIYDTDLDVTWLQDTNITGSPSGATYLDWDIAVFWADNFVYYDSVRDTYWDDWRLPDVYDASCSGYGCTNSELGHLYYVELGNSGNNISPNYGPFTGLNITNPNPYFHEGNSLNPSWIFALANGPGSCCGDSAGLQQKANGGQFRIWAVRDGDVTVVPEPLSSTLFLAGSGALGFLNYKRRKVRI